jgi:hypothetical protein
MTIEVSRTTCKFDICSVLGKFRGEVQYTFLKDVGVVVGDNDVLKRVHARALLPGCTFRI